jgi:mandelate racemase
LSTVREFKEVRMSQPRSQTSGEVFPRLSVRDCEARPVVVPMKRPLRTASGAVTQAPLVLVDLHTAEGVRGRAYLFGFQPFVLRPLCDLVSALAGMVQGDAVSPVELDRKLRGRLTLVGAHNLTGIALAGIDMAAWDALARAAGAALASLLGGAPGPVAAYNSNGLGIMPAKEAADEAVELLEGGFGAIKIRLGRASLADDLAAVRAVRKRIPDGVHLMADFNQALSVAEALARGHALDGEGLYWIEEPIRADDLTGCARVAAELRTPVQIGENFSGLFQMHDALAARASDFVMPDAQRIGGVTGWLRAAALASAAGIEMSSHLFAEVSAHLLAVTPTRHWLEYVDWASPILEQPLEIRDGAAIVPDRPGNGLEWTEEAVRRYLLR